MVDAQGFLGRVWIRNSDLWLGILCRRHHDAKYLLATGGDFANDCSRSPGTFVPAKSAACIDIMRPQRVLFITVVPSPYQRDLFRALATRKELALSVLYLEVAAPDSPWPQEPLEEYERILRGFWLPLFGARWHVNWGLAGLSQYDLVVLNNFASATAQWLMRYRLRGKRWLFWGERLRIQPTGWRRTMQQKLIDPLKNASAIVGIGSDAENDYRRRFPGTRHFCIPYHCDLTRFLEITRPRSGADGMTFLFCGQMIRRKGIDLLLRAFEQLVAKGLDVQLLLVGREAELPELLPQVKKAARDRVNYEGFQPPDQLHRYFAQADVFVLPSRHEGWGVVVNQALGAGLPVICSDAVGAGTDLVRDQVNGLRFSAGDVEKLQSCLELLAKSPEVAREWGKASRDKAFAITPQAGAEKWVRVIDEIAKIS
jgi:glycosyltransferase involved in cell wall biosynthesis